MGLSHNFVTKSLLVCFLFVFNVNAQLYNKEVRAKIKIDQNSEFATFTATAENMTISDFSLSYDFMVFRTSTNNTIDKTNQSQHFYIKANEKLVLSSSTVNNTMQGKVIIVLFLYDDANKPIGKDRIEITNDGSNNLVITLDNLPLQTKKAKQIKRQQNKDQDTASKDGLFLNGLVLQKTLTKVGKDFHKYFFSEYYNKQIKSSKNILIKEIPGRGRSTQISVYVGDKIVWQFFTRPDKKFLKQMSSFALTKCIAHLRDLAKRQNSVIQY